mmetsp:Transcript_2155/g.7686  ORF Transcript_2155/g.7686 Transcript_2155/m.7686 type:complete len:615 (+) Transcript_2155:174-2018(+)
MGRVSVFRVSYRIRRESENARGRGGALASRSAQEASSAFSFQRVTLNKLVKCRRWHARTRRAARASRRGAGVAPCALAREPPATARLRNNSNIEARVSRACIRCTSTRTIAADATELPDAAAPAANAHLAAIDEKLLPAWEKDALEARWPAESARGLKRAFSEAFTPVAEGERAEGAVAALHARDERVERLRVDGKGPKIVSRDTLSLTRASGGLALQTTWLHADSMQQANARSLQHRHSAGYYTKDGDVSPQLACMIAGDATRGVVACAFDGCTAALPGAGHHVEPPAAVFRPSTQGSVPIARALSLDGRASILLLEGRKPNAPAWWDDVADRLATRRVDLTASTLLHAPAVVGCARPSASTFGLKNAKVIGFEFERPSDTSPAYLLKLPSLSESGSTLSPCFARCPHRAYWNAQEVAFVQLFAAALLARGPPRALREHGVVQHTRRYWRLGDQADATVEWMAGFEDLRSRAARANGMLGGRPAGSGVGFCPHGVPGDVEVSLLCPHGHLFWHEWCTSQGRGRTLQPGCTPGGRVRAGAGKKALHNCEKCKLGYVGTGGSKLNCYPEPDGTCRCLWSDGSWTRGCWHARSSVEERAGQCELCETLLDEAEDDE